MKVLTRQQKRYLLKKIKKLGIDPEQIDFEPVHDYVSMRDKILEVRYERLIPITSEVLINILKGEYDAECT